METITPHFASSPPASEAASLDESELLVQWSEFVLHPLRSLASTPIVLGVTASAAAHE